MKRKIVLIILIILILCIFLFQNRKNQDNLFQDELIFFKWFSFEQENSENIPKSESQITQAHSQYRFYVSYKNIDFKNIYLSHSINRETLIQEKIAPGTKGAFEIVLDANEKTHYQIKFESKNEKPENLTFKIEGKDKKYQRLEEMEQELQGECFQNIPKQLSWIDGRN